MSVLIMEMCNVVYQCDECCCVVCGVFVFMFQYCCVVGMGGLKNVLLFVDGFLFCVFCNVVCEGVLQVQVFCFGWKVCCWVIYFEWVFVFYLFEMVWYCFEGVVCIWILCVVVMEMGCSVYGVEWMFWYEVIV